MKTIILFLALLPITGNFSSIEDEKLIKEVITEAYVNGIQNAGSLEDIEEGFHPSFELIGIGRDSVTVWENHIYTWKERVRQHKISDNDKDESLVTCTFDFIDITGNACVAKIHLYRDNKHIFTDYLSLYKFKDGWKIVSKIFYRH
jgi:hypothetical protein